MKIGYGIMLDVASRNFVRRIQLELHHQVGIGVARQPPHVTVKSPFEVTQIAPHRKYLDALSKKLKGLEVEVDGFRHFADKVIYLDVKHTPALIDLHTTILQDVEENFGLKPLEFEGENIKLHASVAGFEDKGTFKEAQGLLSKYSPRFTFRLAQLGLFYYLGPGKGWIVHHLADVLSEK
jgi:2'-5' RNA ligase